MGDKFDEVVEELNLESFEEDFEAKEAEYQVWVLGYDKNQAITDFEHLVKKDKDAELMVEYAKRYVEEEKYNILARPEEVEYLEVVVETVVDFEDHTENVGTLFTEIIKVK